METYYKAINWNAIEDVIDKSTWEKLTEQFWLDTRIPLSNDLDDWRNYQTKKKTWLEKSLVVWPFWIPCNLKQGFKHFAQTSVHHMRKLFSTTSSLWNLSTQNLILLSFQPWIPRLKSKKSLNGPTLTPTYKEKQKLSMKSTSMVAPLKRKLPAFSLKPSFSTLVSSHPSTISVTTNWPTLRKSSNWSFVMSLFTEPTLVTNSNLVSTNYLKKSKKSSKRVWMLYSRTSR